MKYKSLLIVTYGRSGSTLLQGILNSIPECVVRGENYNFIYPLFTAYNKLKNAKKMEYIHQNTPQDSWFGASKIDLELYLKTQKQMIKQLLIADSNAKYYGFKEIRYFDVLYDLERFLEFLELVMEDVAIIFNIRNSLDVSQSSWWKRCNKEILIPKLEKANTKFMHLAAEKDNAFCFNYDDLISEDGMCMVKDLFEFLDVNFDEKKIQSIISIDHSQNNTKKL